MNEYYFGYKTLCTVQAYIKSKIGIEDKYTFKGTAQAEAVQVVEVMVSIFNIQNSGTDFFFFYDRTFWKRILGKENLQLSKL